MKVPSAAEAKNKQRHESAVGGGSVIDSGKAIYKMAR